MIAQVSSVPHGGPRSGCCIYCDPDVQLTVEFEDGTVGVVRRARRSSLGKGFAIVQVRWPGRTRFVSGVLTPRDKVRGRA